MIAMTGVALCAMNYWFKFLGDHAASVTQVVMGILVISSLALDTHKMDKADQKLFSGSRALVKPKTPLINRGWRMLLFLAFVVEIFLFHHVFVQDRSGVLFFKLVHHFLALELAAAAYFAAVTPLPPGKSKIREFVESFSAGFKKLAPVTRPQK